MNINHICFSMGLCAARLSTWLLPTPSKRTVLVCHYEILGGLNNTNLFLTVPEAGEVQDQGASKVGFILRPLLLAVDSHLLLAMWGWEYLEKTRVPTP